ncbi:MAG: SDR family NAD(P)-dependent oxidoreductase [Pseudomonadales bacterium]|jgi:malonyl-CoA reductase/3-hydroxypropionate dehydrogenase (NADP+)|nr:SDR family NAD(P)-dependent oxidoreductase [Pseudomonadales bacterium]
MTERTESTSGARLAGRTVVLTGAAGNIGSYISRRLLREGARLVMTGRDGEKLDAFARTLAAEGFDPESMATVVGDCADADSCRHIVAAAVERFGPIDVLVNNAGGPGPRRTLREIPFTEAQKRAHGDDETMTEAAMNLLGGPWNMARAAIPHMAPCGSIVNVSTIFSRTRYFGRIPYAVPKSGLNALSLALARELGGERGIRVNTVFPGPVKSERIDRVFANMDALQGLEPGSTSHEFRSLMTHKRKGDEAEGDALDFRYPTPEDVASTILFLSSEESAAFSGHAFEVTNGMQVPAQSRSNLVSWPDDRLVDLTGKVVLVLGGSDLDEALVFAERNLRRGARIVLGMRTLQLVGRAEARVDAMGKVPIHVQHLDPLRGETVDRVFQFLQDHFRRLDGIVVLPAVANGEHGYSLATADDEDVRTFIETEIVAPVAFASALTRNLASWRVKCDAPPTTFVTNQDDGRGNRMNEIRRAAIEELIRIWRYEERKEIDKGAWGWSNVPNQLVRYDNGEPDNLAFAADWTATLNNGVRKMDPINLWVPKNILRATGKSAMPLDIQRVLPGLHRGKTAVITGGSMGIGMQLGRYLAMAGARVLLSARSLEKLEAAREEIVAELRGIGYPDPEGRVTVLGDIDVADEAAMRRLFDHATNLYGDVDFLINNAGIAGAEEMVVDMALEDWNRTMEANLISNYSLIRKFAPRMKARGRGVVLNVSSYFGGEKYLAVAYPNRSDYSVSKAGQRVLAEILSRHLGPEIQINAMAPGPVDGVRLRGQPGAPGLFDRRGRLILENIRLTQVHTAALAMLEAGEPKEHLLALACNSIEELAQRPDASKPLRRLLVQVGEGNPDASSSRWLLSASLAPKLMNRLVSGGLLEPEDAERFLDAFVSPPSPFFAEKDVKRQAEKIGADILARLHLHKMPTDEQVALSTVFSLADEIVSGETFHPSGGLKFDRSVTEGELLLPPGKEELAALAGRHVLLIGDAMRHELTEVAHGFIDNGVRKITLLTRDEDAAGEIRHGIERGDGVDLAAFAVGDDLEGGIGRVLRERGRFDVVVNTPFVRLPLNALAAEPGENWEHVLSRDQFAAVVHDHLTHHFRVARLAALVPRCQIVLVTPDTSRASTREEFALALFVKNSLHAFTVTLGVEGERLPTVPAVNQVQLTRRARTEEPGTEQEVAEELKRLVYAVLQCSVPAPSPQESRYRSRIFRGNAVTV